MTSGELVTRINCMINSQHIDEMLEAGVRTGLGNEWVRVGGMKQVCDGSISERTARLSEPYVGRPDDFGIVVTEEKDLYERARKAHEAGWQNGIHANGDVGIGMVLNVYERLQRELPQARSALPDRALHSHQRRPGAANEGAGRDPDALLDLCVLPRREDEGIRRGAAELDVRAPQFPRCGHSTDAGFGLSARARSSR